MRLPLLAEGFEQPVGTPVADGTSGPFGRLRQSIPFGPHGRVLQLAHLLVGGQGHERIPSVEDVEDEPAGEVEPQPERVGQGEGQHSPTGFGGQVAAAQLMLHEVPVLGVHLEQVPVERSVGSGAHLAHEDEHLIAELAHRRNELERGARVLAHHTAQRDEFVAAGAARRHGMAVMIVVARRPGAREPQATGGEAVAQQLLHRRHFIGRGFALGGGGTHDHAPQCRVAHEETCVGHERSIESVEVAGSGGPVPRQPHLQALEWHALHTGEHAHEVVGIFGTHGGVAGGGERGDGEPAVTPDDRGDPVQR